MSAWDFWNIKGQIQEFAEKKNLCIKMLSNQKKNDILQGVKEKYLRKEKWQRFPLFEVFNYQECIAINEPESWRWIKDFITEDPIIVFFNDDEVEDYFEFPNTETFVELYDDMPLVEFYIVDSKLTYLLAYNHSQCLITMGNARNWIANYEKYKRWCEQKTKATSIH